MVKLTPWVRPKDVPLQMRPLVLHIAPYGDVRTFFRDIFKTSLGRNFAEWVTAKPVSMILFKFQIYLNLKYLKLKTSK